MATKPVHVPPGSVVHPIDPRTGKPFANVADQIAYEVAERLHSRTALAMRLAHRSLQREGRRPRHEGAPTPRR